MRHSKKSKTKFRSICPIASTLDLVGDKWSLLVVRDLLHGKETYSELASSPEKIPTNILADRLRRLEEAGLIVSSAYQERPVRFAYKLTAKGKASGDVLLALVRWRQDVHPRYEDISRSVKKSKASFSGAELVRHVCKFAPTLCPHGTIRIKMIRGRMKMGGRMILYAATWTQITSSVRRANGSFCRVRTWK